MQRVIWTSQFNGQSPGDLYNKKNGFAGRFLGYDERLRSPCDVLSSVLPVMLVVGDSIIGDISVSNIRSRFQGIANVNFLQQPHHCKNIDSWLLEWEVENWTHYHCIFWFDGMHGFPERVTEAEHLHLTPLLVEKIKKNTKNLLWCNCPPIPDNMPQGRSNDANGPNSKDQKLSNESVINRNISIKNEMTELNVELLDIYSKMKPIQHLVQRTQDIHFLPKGEMLMSNYICNKLKEMYFT
jgi:hypothetical protein